MSGSVEEEGLTLFVEEFVKIAKDASLFSKEDAWADASSRVIELVIRLKPEIDAYLHLTPFPHLRINDFLSKLSASSEALKHVVTFIGKYDEALRAKKRECVQRKIEEATEKLTPDQKVRYILEKFATEHYRIFEESFSIIRSDKSNSRAIIKAAQELATDFIYQISYESESLPQNLLESYLWASSGVWRSTLRSLGSFKNHYIWDSFDFHNDDRKGFSMFDFHTHSVTVFIRNSNPNPKAPEESTESGSKAPDSELVLWARKSELEIQAELFGRTKDFKKGIYTLELLRHPFDYEEDHFNHLSDEELAEGFIDITQQLQEKRLAKEMEEEPSKDEGKDVQDTKPVKAKIPVPVPEKVLVPPSPELNKNMDSILDQVLEEAVKWPAEIISDLSEFAVASMPAKKFTPEELEEAWKYILEARVVGATLLTTIPWAMRVIEVEGRSLMSTNILKSGSLHVLGHVATTAGLHVGARVGAGYLGGWVAGALVSPVVLTCLPIAVGIGASVLIHMRKSGKSEGEKIQVPLNPNAVQIIKQAMEKGGKVEDGEEAQEENIK